MLRDIASNIIIPSNAKKGKSEWLYSVPEGLFEFLQWIRKNYNNVEVLITENGWSDDGQLEDDERIEYLRVSLCLIEKKWITYLNIFVCFVGSYNCNTSSYT